MVVEGRFGWVVRFFWLFVALSVVKRFFGHSLAPKPISAFRDCLFFKQPLLRLLRGYIAGVYEVGAPRLWRILFYSHRVRVKEVDRRAPKRTRDDYALDGGEPLGLEDVKDARCLVLGVLCVLVFWGGRSSGRMVWLKALRNRNEKGYIGS